MAFEMIVIGGDLNGNEMIATLPVIEHVEGDGKKWVEDGKQGYDCPYYDENDERFMKAVFNV